VACGGFGSFRHFVVLPKASTYDILGQAQIESPPSSQRARIRLLNEVKQAVTILAEGGVVSVPTDTLYGLAASAYNEQAVERIYRIKRRPAIMALPVLLADPLDILQLTDSVPDLVWRLTESFSPGPLTMVLRRGRGVPDFVSAGQDTIGVRVPDHWIPRTIIRDLGEPITGTSANRTGSIVPCTAEAVRAELGGDVDLVIDDGPSDVEAPSTVIDLSGLTPIILRSGAVSKEKIEKVCGISVSVLTEER